VSRINHVSVHARDLQTSIDFYVELFAAEPIPTPNFGQPIQWLSLERTQLHLFEREVDPSPYHHFAITVGDLEPVYRAAAARDVFERETFRRHLIGLPGDIVQLYLRDPAGNLVEVDCAGIDRLPGDIRAELTPLEDLNPQSEENLRGLLYVHA
jgi:catechol 2,3-dioxygenase-like lactoylglutathione lyase family enzyme